MTIVINNTRKNIPGTTETNKTGTIDKWQEQQQAAIREACSGDTPISCETAVAGMGSIMAWPWLPGFAATTSLVGAGANAGVGLLVNGEVNPNDVIFAYWTGAFTAGTGLWGTMVVNAASGGASSYLKGDDPLKGGALSGAASGLGYGFGKIVQGQFDKALNPNWKNWAWENIGVGISRPMPLDPLPGIFGNTGAALGTEVINNQVGKVDANELKGEKK